MARRLLFSTTMLKLFVLMFALAGCAFAPMTQDVQADAQPPGVTTDGNTLSHACHVTDSSLRLCLDFEDTSLDPTVADFSSFHHDGAAKLVSPVERATQQAALFAATSRLHVDETPDLDLPDHLTVELWSEVLDPSARPRVFDNDGQYSLAIDHDKMFCYANGSYAITTISLGITWHHLACTYGEGKLIAFVDGKQAACANAPGMIDSNANTDGTDIGYGLVGGVDNVHVYARALSDPEIATLAGTTAGTPVPCTNNNGE